jgi:hypothetical protein
MVFPVLLLLVLLANAVLTVPPVPKVGSRTPADSK